MTDPLAEKAYFKIGEVAAIIGVETHTIRYWEKEFPGVRPAKTRSRQRVFQDKDIALLRLIRYLLHEERFTVAGARQRIKEFAQAGVSVEDALLSLQSAAQELEPVQASTSLADMEAQVRELRAENSDLRKQLQQWEDSELADVQAELAQAQLHGRAMSDTVDALREEVEKLRSRRSAAYQEEELRAREHLERMRHEVRNILLRIQERVRKPD